MMREFGVKLNGWLIEVTEPMKNCINRGHRAC